MSTGHRLDIAPWALSVGWLDSSEPFAMGPVAADLLDRLLLLMRSPVELTRGSHPCAFCLVGLRARHGEGLNGKPLIQALRDLGALGNGEIVVRASAGICYIAPTLVLHDVERDIGRRTSS